MADLILRIRGDVDAKELQNFSGTAEELRDKIKSVEAAADDLSGKKIAIEIDTTVKGSGEITKVVEVTRDLDKATLKLDKAIKKATNTEKGSVASSRALVATLTAQRNAVRTGSNEYVFLTQRLNQANKAYREAQGIQEGSTRDIQRQISFFKQLQASTNQTGKSARDYTETIRRLNGELRAQQGIQEGSKTSLQALRAELIQSRDAIDRFTDPAEFARLQNEIQKTDDRLDAFVSTGQRINRVIDSVARLRVVFDTVSQVGQVLNGVIGTFVARTKQVESFGLALQNVGLDVQEVNTAFEQAESTANKLGAPLQSVERSYKRMIPSLVAIGTESGKSDKFIEALTARTQTLGLNTEETGRLVEAFAQVLSKGRLSGEELNQQISELDGAFRGQFADALGISTAALTELVETGAVSSADFVDGVLKMRNGVDALADRINSGNATIQQLQNQINNIRTKNIERLAEDFDPFFRTILKVQLEFEKLVQTLSESGAFEGLARLLQALADGFKLFAQAIKAVVIAVGAVINPIVQLFTFIDKFFPVLSLAANALGVFAGALAALLAFGGLRRLLSFITAEILKMGIAAVGTSGKLKVLAVSLRAVRGGKLGLAFASLAKGITGAGTAAGFGKTAFAALGTTLKVALVPAIKFVAIGAAIAAAIGFILKPAAELLGLFGGWVSGLKNAGDATKGAEQELKKFKETSLEPDGLDRLITKAKELAQGFLDAINVFKAFSENFKNQEIVTFNNQIDKTVAKIDEIRKVQSLGNTVLTKNTDLMGLNEKQLKQAAKAQESARAATLELKKGLEERLKAIKGNTEADETARQAIRNQIETRKAEIAVIDGALANISKTARARGFEAEAVTTSAQAYREATKAVSDFQAKSEEIDLQGQAESYRKLAAGIYDVNQAEASNLGTTASLREIELGLLKQQEQALKRLIKDGKASTADKDKLKELQKEITEATVETAEAQKQVRDAIVDAFARGIEEANKLADIAQGVASRIKGVFDGISSGATSGIQAGLQVVQTLSASMRADIDRETAARIAGAERSGLVGISLERRKQQIENEGTEKKRDILREELATKGKMADIEYEIEQIRLAVTTRVKIAEAQALQARLAGEAALARARGDNDVAIQLEKAAAAQDTVIRGVQLEAQLQERILGFRRDQQKAAISSTAAANNLSNFQVPGIDNAISKLNNFVGVARRGTREFARMSNQAQRVATNLQAKNLQGGVDEAKKTEDAIKNAASSTGALANNMKGVAGAFTNATRQAGQLLSIVRQINASTGTARRAMGGPVDAGSQYIVNDGGGREAFLNSFGRMSMLPAGRNIKWTAPSSGTVIPAHLVEDFKNRLMAREQVNNLSSYQQPQQAVSRNIIKSNHTKNLTSSSSTQRIVNHVTIQSQSPVTDASKLMANVSKLKSRRRI